MARDFSDLQFNSASCCGSHQTATVIDSAGSEWYFKRDGDIYSIMRMTGGRLDGPLRAGLTRHQAEAVLTTIK